MKKILLLVVFGAGLILTSLPLQAAAPVLAARFHGGHSRVIVGLGGWGWGWGWGWGYPGYVYEPYGYSYGPPVWARVKTDVDPEEARLYLDGQLIGTADDFDGWPDYLYLRRGRYRLEFRLNGYETKTVDVDARPGQTLRIDDKLRKIPGAKKYGSYDEPKIEGGIQRFWAKRRDVAQPADPYGERGDDRRRDYGRDDRRSDVSPEYDRGDPEPSEEARPRDEDWRGGRSSGDATAQAPRMGSTRSRLQFKVEPSDAAVYVDDRFVGTADEVNSLDRGLAIPPGKHTVTVSRPGFKDRSVDIEVKSGGSEKVEVSLGR